MWRAGLLAVLGVSLGACAFAPGSSYFAGPRTPHPTYKIGGPYTVNGITYYPHVDYAYDRIGVASWYGEQFQGRYTANGEVFDLNGVSAAHTTLPLPSIVEVVNLQNNRALRVRVNDRGPFVDGRVIDLSRRAAQLLGFERSGTTTVRVRVLKDESLYAAALAARGQVSDDRAPVVAASAPAAVAAVQRPAVTPATHRFFVEDPVYHVQAGPVATQTEADGLRARLIANGYRDARIVMD